MRIAGEFVPRRQRRRDSALVAQAQAKRIATLQARYGVRSVTGTMLETHIDMHVTEWSLDEHGIRTRRIWAVGSIVER